MSVTRRSLAVTALIAGLTALFAVALRLAATSDPATSTGSIGPITRVDVSRQTARPDNNGSVRTVDDGRHLHALEVALRESGWTPGRERWDADGCEGGVRTLLTIHHSDGSVRRYDGYRCGDGSPPVVRTVDAVVDQW